MASNGRFYKAIINIAKGNLIAQIITLISLPIITRLYTPEQYNEYAIYTSLINMLVVMSSLRFEIALPIVDNEEEAENIYIMGLIANVLVLILNFIVFIPIYFYSNHFYFIFIPFGIFMLGLFNLNHNWYLRSKEFKRISSVRIVQSLYGNLFQIIYGVWSANTFGLVMGNFIKSSMGVFKLVSFQKIIKNLLNFNLKKGLFLLKKYKKYPTLSTLEAILNSMAIYFPIIAIGYYMDDKGGGYLMLAMSIIGLPTLLLGRSIASAYHSYAPEKYRCGELNVFTQELVKRLIIFCGFPLLLFSILSPLLFPIFFGKEWKQAGLILQGLAPWFFMQALVSPISMVFNITNNQKTALYIQIFGFFIRVFCLVLVLVAIKELSYIYLYMSGFLFYFIYFLFALKYSQVNILDFFSKLRGYIIVAILIYLIGVFYAVK